MIIEGNANGDNSVESETAPHIETDDDIMIIGPDDALYLVRTAFRSEWRAAVAPDIARVLGSSALGGQSWNEGNRQGYDEKGRSGRNVHSHLHMLGWCQA
jgi:hypothetical protein